MCGLWLGDGDDLVGDAAVLAGPAQADLTETEVTDNGIGLCGRLRTAGTGPDLLREVEAWLEKLPASGHHVRTSTEIVRP